MRTRWIPDKSARKTSEMIANERKNVQAMVDGFKASIPRDPTTPKVSRIPTQAEALAGLDDLMARVSGPIEFSDVLRERIFGEIDEFAREVCR